MKTKYIAEKETSKLLSSKGIKVTLELWSQILNLQKSLKI